MVDAAAGVLSKHRTDLLHRRSELIWRDHWTAATGLPDAGNDGNDHTPAILGCCVSLDTRGTQTKSYLSKYNTSWFDKVTLHYFSI